MKKLIIATCALAALASVAFGGTETYSGKQTAVQPTTLPGMVSGHGVEREPLGHVFVHWVKLEG